MDARSLLPALPAPAPGGLDTIKVLLDRFDLRPRTRAGYAAALTRFAAHLSGRPPTAREVLAFREALLAEGRTPGTVNQYLAAVRTVFAALEAEGICPNPARAVKGVRTARGFRREALSAEDARRVLEAIAGDGLEARRDRALVNLLLRTGLRGIEASRADVGDLREHAGATVLWVQGKGHHEKDQYVVMTEPALGPLRAYLAGRGQVADDAPLFAATSNRNRGGRLTTRSIRRIVTRALAVAGVKTDRVTAHSTRHTAATLALRGGADVRAVQKMMRHRSVRTTELYAHDLERVDAGAERAIRF